jgi:hypothetical protein
MRLLFMIGLPGIFATGAFAQQPGPFQTQTYPLQGLQFRQYGPTGNPNVMPNIFNPQTQPLSPYLNLLRGGNVATNYFFAVRPGTIGLTPRGVGGAPFLAPGGNRMLFFPQFATSPDPTMGGVDSPTALPPAGHPVVFGNTMGFFPTPFGQAGGARPALSGLGTTRPTRR